MVRKDTGNQPRLGSGKDKGAGYTARGKAGGRNHS